MSASRQTWRCDPYWVEFPDATRDGFTVSNRDRQTLNRFARDHAIPVRTRGTSSYTPASAVPGIHPRDLPEPLRSALVGPSARGRLDRLLVIAGHPSILAAA
jgi:hypothetical protein